MVEPHTGGYSSCPTCDYPQATAKGCPWCGWTDDSGTMSPPDPGMGLGSDGAGGHMVMRGADLRDSVHDGGAEGPHIIIQGVSSWYRIPDPARIYSTGPFSGEVGPGLGQPQSESFWNFLGRLGYLGLTLSVLLTLLLGNTLALLLALPYVFTQIDGWQYYLGLPYPGTFLAQRSSMWMLKGSYLQLYWLFIWVSLVLSLAWLAYRQGSSFHQWLKEWHDHPQGRPSNALREQHLLGVMAGFWAVSALFSLLVYWLAAAGGAEPQTIDLQDDPAWFALFLLANASVWEELMFRVVLVGLPLTLIALLRRTGHGSTVQHHLFGGHDEWDLPTTLLVVLSSAYFAYAHVGGGWDWFKVPGTMVAGLMFAYLFVRWGLYTSIVFHFLFDYALALNFLVQDRVVGSWANGPLVISLLALLVSLLCALLCLRWLIPVYLRGLRDSWSRTRQGLGALLDHESPDP